MNPFGSKRSPDPSLAPALAALERTIREHPDLAAAGGTLRAILHVLYGESLGAPAAWTPPPSDGATPLFRLSPPPVDRERARLRTIRLAEILRPINPAGASALTRDRGRGFADWAGRGFFRGEDPPEFSGASPSFIRSTLRLVLTPETAPRTVEPVPPLAGARCGYCGEAFALAEARGLERARRLRCGLCASDSPAARTGCPACGDSGAGRTRFHTFDGEGERRGLLCCDDCGLRLKVVNALDRLSPPALLVAELRTAHLDFIDVGADSAPLSVRMDGSSA